ncbi:MAG: SOS response-associated peptidase [Planctomycetota bacterium]|nr:MAG: SOS response-associated peptidase [Planctomycetota bacterium]
MCGRFNLRASPKEIAAAFGVRDVPEFPPRFNIAPTQPVIVVCRLTAEQLAELLAVPSEGRTSAGGAVADRVATWMRWGLVPHWADDPSIGSRMINARAESVARKPAFRAAFRRRRCLIPASGFYEWKKTPAGKQPYHVYLPGRKVFGFAGIWEHWTGADGSELLSCAIITTDANELVAQVHDRMPVIVPPEAYDLWLQPEGVSLQELESLLRPYPAEEMAMVPISRRINNPRNDDPECLRPVGEPAD